jgi:anti-sigma B factor antagonist
MRTIDAMDEIATVMLPKQLDSETSASVEVLIVDALRPQGRLIVDGSEVGYMSAAGVRTFARVLHRAQEIDAQIVFCSFSGPAVDCLVVSGFSELFDIAASRDDARKRLQSKSAGKVGERLHPHGGAG